MRHLLLAALFAAAPAAAAVADHPDDPMFEAMRRAQAAAAARKADPCQAENHQFNFFELLLEAVPVYASARPPEGKPPSSVVLTMDRCDVLTKDHVEGNPMTPTAERWYTDGDWGVILTTASKSEKTSVTVVSKRNGSWTTAGQMGEFVSVELFDTWDKGKAVVKLAHWKQGGIELPYALHVSIRPSWNR